MACSDLFSRKLFLITLTQLFKKWVGSPKSVACSVLCFNKTIPNNTTTTFQEVHFVDGIRTSHGIAFTITKFIDFYSQVFFLLFCLPPFSIEMNQKVNS